MQSKAAGIYTVLKIESIILKKVCRLRKGMINMKNKVIIIAVCIIMLCGCGKDSSGENNQMTVSQEIAAGISENVVPAEAFDYSFLSYNVPEGFVAANDNTDMQAIYVSETQGDLSYICYTRQLNEGLIDYMEMSAEDYRDMFSLNLGAEVTVEQCRQEEKEGWIQVDLLLTYEQDGNAHKTWQNIYVTDKYVFTIVCVRVGDAPWEGQFSACVAQAVPRSIVEETSGEN